MRDPDPVRGAVLAAAIAVAFIALLLDSMGALVIDRPTFTCPTLESTT